MSSLTRMFAVLDLFSTSEPVWTADRLIERLGYTRPTGYRYVRELVRAGFLMRIAPGAYALGPRVIELDYIVRRADPLLVAGMPVIKALVGETGCDVTLAGLYGEHILNTHWEAGIERLALTFARGRTMPLLRGASSKAIVALFPRARLKQLYAHHAADAAVAGWGNDWEAFRTKIAAIRKAGFAVSRGELDPGFAAIAAPVLASDGEILGSISIVLSQQRLAVMDFDRLAALTREAGRKITAAVGSLDRGTPTAQPPAREREAA